MSSLTNSFNGINSESKRMVSDLSQTIQINELKELIDSYPFNKSENKIKIENSMRPKFNIIKQKRKDKEDNIRKKIKASFHKALRKIINQKLKEIGSKYLFNPFPSSFICDISKKTNFEVMQLTYEELFDYAYNKYKYIDGKEYIIKRKEVAEKQYNKNIEILKYLDSNKRISEESGWEVIKNMKYMDLFKAYFYSNEFEQNVEKLSKKETTDYINAYIYFSSTYVDYFLGYEPNKNDKMKNDNNHNNTNCHTLNSINLSSIFTSIFENEEDEELEPFFSFQNFDNELTKNNDFFKDDFFLIKENKIIE